MKSPRAYFRLAVLVLCAAPTGAFAQSSTPAPAGPVPPAIIHAKSIFVSNAGADSDLFPGSSLRARNFPISSLEIRTAPIQSSMRGSRPRAITSW